MTGSPVSRRTARNYILPVFDRKNRQITPPRERRINQTEFDDEFQTIFNGLPNIWEADISQIYQLKAVKS